MKTAYDCQSCGACCMTPYYEDPTYIQMEPKEYDVLPRHRRRLAVLNRQWNHYDVKTKRDRDGNTVCAFLVGRIGTKVRCGIYADRPRICSAFKAGSDECKGSRQELSLPL